MSANGSLLDQPFRVLTDDARYFVIAEVDERTAKRAAALLAEGDGSLPDVVSDALNLHAMPKLIARAGL